MKTVLATIILLLAATPSVFAHRLDEYLQDTSFFVAKDHLSGWARLTPGVDVFAQVMAEIDTDYDGAISDAEKTGYANRVLADFSLSTDHQPLQLRLVSVSYPTIEKMQEGMGDILIEFGATLPPATGNRTLTFENHHQPHISAYLVNSFVPEGPDIHITAQHRNYEQSSYELDYVQSIPPIASKTNVVRTSSIIRMAIGSIVSAVVASSLVAWIIRRRRMRTLVRCVG